MREAAEAIVHEVAAVRRDEHVLVVIDSGSDKRVEAILLAALHGAAESTEVMPASAFLARESDMSTRETVLFSLATPLLTHTDQMRTRLAAGARYVNLRGIDIDLLAQAGQTDFAALEIVTDRAAAVLSRTHSVLVSDAAGTELTMRGSGQALALSGLARVPGSIGGFPSGEAALVPVEGSASGIVAVPGFVEGFAGDTAATQLHFVDGRLAKSGRGDALAFLLSTLGPLSSGRAVSEFGMGTNPALRPATARTAKKSLGTAHIGLGDNQSFGGSVMAAAHIDVILFAPTVALDGYVVIDRGSPRSELWKS